MKYTGPNQQLFSAKPLSLLASIFLLSASISSIAQSTVFTDDFESASLNPFWSISASGGSVIFPSTAQAHTGSQSVQINSLAGVTKHVFLEHDLAPSYGHVSVWLYDNGADLSSANYMGLFLGSMLVPTFDYDLGANNGGHYNYQIGGGPSIASPIDRTVGWHQFAFDSTESALKLSIDGTVVYAGAGGRPITALQIGEYGPAFRPAWSSYFDDFQANLITVPTVPEPSALALAGFGALAMSIMAWRKRTAGNKSKALSI